MVLGQVVQGWWIIVPLVLTLALMAAYYVGVEVGKDSKQVRDAFFDGLDEGWRLGYMRALEGIDEAPPLAEGLGGRDA